MAKTSKSAAHGRDVTYRIKRWSDIYENSRSRRLQRLDWVRMPVNLNGATFRRLMHRHQDADSGMAIFGAFVATVELAATCDTRGTLIQTNGEPHDVETIALQTGASEQLIAKMLKVLTAKPFCWIEEVGIEPG